MVTPTSEPAILGTVTPPVPKQPDPLPALLDMTLDKALEKAQPLNLIKDSWELTHVADYHKKVDEARDARVAIMLKYGRGSAEDRVADQRYWETLLFEVPVLGRRIELLFWALNKVARPVQ
jgi:hypothetical protein